MANIRIELTDEEAERYKFFQQHYELFRTLLDGGVFNTSSGYVTLMFNGEAKLMEIRKEIRTYRNGR